jgi:hypothetical protein
VAADLPQQREFILERTCDVEDIEFHNVIDTPVQRLEHRRDMVHASVGLPRAVAGMVHVPGRIQIRLTSDERQPSMPRAVPVGHRNAPVPVIRRRDVPRAHQASV